MSTVKVTKSAAKGTVKAVKSIAKSDVGKAAIKTGSKMAVDTAMASLKDELIKVGGRIGKFSGSVSFEDDDDLVDDLGFKKFMKKAGKGTVKAVKSIAKSDVGKAAIKTGSKMAADTAMASLKDELISIGGRVGKFSGSVKFDDDDDDDDLVDELKAGDKIKSAAKKVGNFAKSTPIGKNATKAVKGVKAAVAARRKDELKFEKVKAVAGKAAQRFPGAASKV